MRIQWVMVGVWGFALPLAAQDQPAGPSSQGCGGSGGSAQHYLPAKVMTCGHGHCWWHDAAPSDAYLFADPVACFGAHCPAGTIGPHGLRQ